jgi:hypothetical protein
MLGDKRIFMELGDGKDFESLKSKEQKELKEQVQEEAQDFALDEAIDKLLGGVDVLEISGGMAIVAIPLQMLKMLSKFGELLNKREKGIER